ncbi:MAG: hypothetical protein EOO92_02730 [Pedobacter sp.]|nr:MAG: hypothetical protein EOO92_02730 [Pedobacter sp.]
MKKLLLLVFLVLPFLANAQEGHYKIYDVKQGKVISSAELINNMKSVDVLFFGEEHNDSIGHYLESELFKRLSVAYPARVAASMEMFHRDVQTVMNEYLAGIISEKNFVKE